MLLLAGSPRSSLHSQQVVDAFAAHDFKEGDKAIGLTFALVGLYLHVESTSLGDRCSRHTYSLDGTSARGLYSRCPKTAGRSGQMPL